MIKHLEKARNYVEELTQPRHWFADYVDTLLADCIPDDNGVLSREFSNPTKKHIDQYSFYVERKPHAPWMLIYASNLFVGVVIEVDNKGAVKLDHRLYDMDNNTHREKFLNSVRTEIEEVRNIQS
jgi:hypothetical protein